MPQHRACTTPHCPNYAVEHSYSCAQHKKERIPTVHSLSSVDRGYDSIWNKLRTIHIAKEPLCRLCEQPGQEVDHIIPLDQGGERLNENNLQTLCRRCHAIKTHRDKRKYNKEQKESTKYNSVYKM